VTIRATTTDQVHAVAVVGECANSGQRGRFDYTWDPMGFRRSTRDVEERAQQRSTPVKREAVIAGLASEVLALILGSAGSSRSAFVGPLTTDPVEFRKCARDLEALSAVKEYINEERGGGRDPGVRRPGAGRGQLPALHWRTSLVC